MGLGVIKTIIIAVFTFAFGIFLGRTVLVSTRDIEPSVSAKTPETAVKEVIKEVKVPVYSKNCDSEIAKIEEYYAKAFSLFLSKIGARQNLRELLESYPSPPRRSALFNCFLSETKNTNA